jgi:hypothetical protein
MMMEQYENGTSNVNHPVVKSKIYRGFVPSHILSSILVVSIFLSSMSTYPVNATGGENETRTTVAPGGASLGSAGSGTNVTQSDCLSQNAAANGSSLVDAEAGGANATGPNTTNTSTTFAPSGASIGANDSSTLNATAGNTAGNTTGNTTTTFAPSGASVC